MFLGLDLGTTNVKALLVEPDGQVAARASSPASLLCASDHGVEQDIEELWSATLSAISRLAASNDLTGVQAIGVSSQGGALQVLDPGGRPASRVISWLDGRGRAFDDELTRELGREWFLRHIGRGMSGVAIGQLLRLRRQRPELLERPNRIGFVGDVIVGRLCGRRAHDATSLSIASLYNPSRRTADPDLLQVVGIAEDQLPEMVPVDRAAGGLLREVAEEASLPVDIPVSPAIHDQYAAALGVGAVHAGETMFGAGTAWVLLAASNRLIAPAVDSAFVCTHVIDGLYGQILSLINGGSSFSWTADLVGVDVTDQPNIDRMLEGVAPGSEGVRFWPFLANAGAGLPPEAAGRLTGLRLSHGASHILRSVVEGLSFELRRHLGLLIGSGVEVEKFLMCGGAAAESATAQIVADVIGLSVMSSCERDVSALGAAMVARRLVEPSKGLVALSDVMRPGGREFHPGADAPRYQRLFHEYVASLSEDRCEEAVP
ncbi:MAG: FGGY-family carbohydrate kinase [Planctomycetota bacterium]